MIYKIVSSESGGNISLSPLSFYKSINYSLLKITVMKKKGLILRRMTEEEYKKYFVDTGDEKRYLRDLANKKPLDKPNQKMDK